jgi:hypothetical protein
VTRSVVDERLHRPTSLPSGADAGRPGIAGSACPRRSSHRDRSSFQERSSQAVNSGAEEKQPRLEVLARVWGRSSATRWDKRGPGEVDGAERTVQARSMVRSSPIGGHPAAVMAACPQMQTSLAHHTVLMVSQARRPSGCCRQASSCCATLMDTGSDPRPRSGQSLVRAACGASGRCFQGRRWPSGCARRLRTLGVCRLVRPRTAPRVQAGSRGRRPPR